MSKELYWSLYEHNEDTKRLIYTFTREEPAHDMLEFILKNDPMPIDVRVELVEYTRG